MMCSTLQDCRAPNSRTQPMNAQILDESSLLFNLVLFVLSSQNKRGNLRHFGSNFLVLSCLKVCVSVCMSICGCVCLAMPANVTRSVGASDMHVCMCDDVSVWLGMYAWVWNCIYVCRREGTIHWDHTTVGTQHSGNIIVRLTWWVGKVMNFKTINNLFSNYLNSYPIVGTLFLFPVHLLTPCSLKQNVQHSQFIPWTNYSLSPRH